MKFSYVLFSLVFGCFTAFSQSKTEQLVNEGVALHDKGDFQGAIAKYDAAIEAAPSNYMAMYEKSYSLMALKKYDAAEDVLKKILKLAKEPDIRKLCFVNYGTVLDMEGEKKKSLKIYDQGIKEFPSNYLLHFNKGITQSGMNDLDGAIESFQNALKYNPYHASSHNALGRTVYFFKQRIPAVLSIFTFLIIEPEGSRAEQNLELLNQLIMQGIEKKDEKNVTININPDVLDKKNKRKEDDFSTAELMLSLIAASDKIPDSLGAKTDADKLSYQFQLLIGMIDEQNKNDKGFFKNFYVPMLSEMKKNELVTIASYLAMKSTGKKEITEWLEQNKDDVDGFYRWFENYQWVKN